MTGAEVIIKKGKRFILGKVRHTGMDVEEFFRHPSVFKIPFEDLWKRYFEWRTKDYPNLDDEVETQYPNGFEVVLSEPIQVTLTWGQWGWEFFSDLLNKINPFIAAIDPEEGLLCSYGDYQVFVDYDEQKVYFSSDLE